MKTLLKVTVVVMAVAGGLVTATTTAEATTLSCGQTITQSTVLTNDVGPCANNGIIIGGNGVTFDLNGHTVSCTTNSGDGAAVLLTGRTGVTVKGGTVTECDGGVVILGGSGNTVANMVARHNQGATFGRPGPAALYGDGILVQGSSNNTIVSNQAEDNGPFSGIGLITGDSDHPGIPPAIVTNNVVQNNNVINNIACRRGASPFCDNDGIRLEPWVGSTCLSGPVICPGPGNKVINNSVVNNGLDGISLFGSTTANLVQGNTVNLNGFNGAVRGDGIRVFGSGNIIQINTVNGNNAGGVSVARRPPTAGSFPASNPNGRNNRLIRNTASKNGLYDLWDSNRSPDCDGNLWSTNLGAVVAPPCTLNP